MELYRILPCDECDCTITDCFHEENSGIIVKRLDIIDNDSDIGAWFKSAYGDQLHYEKERREQLFLLISHITKIPDKPAVAERIADINLYCSCSGPGKRNWADGKEFTVCSICHKEQT